MVPYVDAVVAVTVMRVLLFLLRVRMLRECEGARVMDEVWLWCICLWKISQMQTCLCIVVRPGFVSTSPAFMRSSASHPVGPHGRLVHKR